MAGPPVIFYDGNCGLCHGFVQFAVARDRDGRFRFAPLQGAEIRRRIAPEVIRTLPDAVVLLDELGGVHVKSDAALRVLAELGGGWRAAAAVSGVVPRFLRDLVYDFVAGIRHRLFPRPADACPLVPAELRGRFLD
jgi:predicted DCC family thiol-disulfide oxidoreductase YuxK